jgi:hypothetical protein
MSATTNGDFALHTSGSSKHAWIAVGTGTEMDGSMMFVLYGGGTSVLKTPATKRPSEVAIAGNETDEAAGCAPSYDRAPTAKTTVSVMALDGHPWILEAHPHLWISSGSVDVLAWISIGTQWWW